MSKNEETIHEIELEARQFLNSPLLIQSSKDRTRLDKELQDRDQKLIVTITRKTDGE
ncbi:MAG TPA: hypothetical protein VJ964_08995 [Balneolaceae bacterium]|nr:hypothetical protein [Balneolaceae bacterium]